VSEDHYKYFMIECITRRPDYLKKTDVNGLLSVKSNMFSKMTEMIVSDQIIGTHMSKIASLLSEL